MQLYYRYIYFISFFTTLCIAGHIAIGQSSHLIVNPNCHFIVNNATLSVGGKISSSQNFDLQKGTLLLNAVNYDQIIWGDLFSNRTIQNLIIANKNEVKIEPRQVDTLKISGNITFGNADSKLNTGDRLTLLSTYEKTANLGIVGPNNSITGKVTVERYINTGMTPGHHLKSWQLLTAPVTGESIYDSWMEGGIKTLKPIGYGTTATGKLGIEGGFDVYSALPSIKTYSPENNSWVGIGSPRTSSVNSLSGFFIFVRGDRSVFNFSGANSLPVPTILRATGKLITGQTDAIIIKKGIFQSIANPYASSIDFDKISTTKGIDSKFFVWDPTLSGTYGLGGYQTISRVNEWLPVPGGTAFYPSNNPQKQIQSGQVFFVYSTSGNNREELYFTESAKNLANSSKSTSRTEGSGQQKLSTLKINLFTGGGANDLLADGNLVVFDDLYSNLFDENDASKILNEGENFSLKRDEKLLVIEARNPIKIEDTLFYDIKNLKQRNYQFRLYPNNLSFTNLQAYWIDNYLRTETYLSLSDSSVVDFSITSVAGSKANNRFMIIFKPAKILPVDIHSITAIVQNGNISVGWNVENESNIANYLLEKTVDGHYFEEIGIIPSKNTHTAVYSYSDSTAINGKYYYRIKIVDQNGNFIYSKTVFAKILKESKSRIWPNPIQQNEIRVNVEPSYKGAFKVRLFNSAGKLIFQKQLKEESGTLILKTQKLAQGIYHLELTKPGNDIEILEVIKVGN